MTNKTFMIPKPKNELVREYLPGSEEKLSLKEKIIELKSRTIDIPIIIGGQEIKTKNRGNCIIPHNHKHILGTYHKAGEKEIKLAIENSLETWKWWSKSPCVSCRRCGLL